MKVSSGDQSCRMTSEAPAATPDSEAAAEPEASDVPQAPWGKRFPRSSRKSRSLGRSQAYTGHNASRQRLIGPLTASGEPAGSRSLSSIGTFMIDSPQVGSGLALSTSALIGVANAQAFARITRPSPTTWCSTPRERMDFWRGTIDNQGFSPLDRSIARPSIRCNWPGMADGR